MGEHLDKLNADMKAAMKSGQKDRLRVIRSLINAIKQEQHAKAADDLDAGAELAVLQKAAKSRRDAIAQAEEQGRGDIVAAEGAELRVVEEYLPARMSAEELAAKVAALAEEIGYAGPRDTGRFMKEFMARYKGLAEGRDVQEALKKLSG